MAFGDIRKLIENCLQFWGCEYEIEKIEMDDEEKAFVTLVTNELHNFFIEDLGLALHGRGLVLDYFIRPEKDRLKVVFTIRKPLEE
jgi:hypothetical protein